MSTVICPNCSTENADDGRFCIQCGTNLVKMEVVSIDNPFSESDTAAIDGLLYSLSKPRGDDRRAVDDGRTIIALGDVENVPDDYGGSIRTTGKVTFSEVRSHLLTVGYGSDGGYVREAEFRRAAVIRRADDCVLVQTDLGTYRINGSMLDPVRMRIFSRTPIAIVRSNGEFYMACAKDGGYIQRDGEPLEHGKVYRLAPRQEYAVGGFAFFRVG